MTADTINPNARIYVAGAMAELGRAQSTIAMLRQEIGPDVISFDWTVSVAEVQASGTLDAELPTEDRREIALQNLAGIAEADLFWLLASTKGVDSFVELGIAIGMRGEGLCASRIEIVISGEDRRRTLNGELANYSGTDLDAAKYVRGWARLVAARR